MHDEFTTAAEGHTLHCGNHRHLRILQGLRGALEFLDGLFEHFELAGGNGFGYLSQIGTHGERCFMPDHHAIERRFCLTHGGDDPIQHFIADRVHLRFYGNNANFPVDRGKHPKAHPVVFVERFSRFFRGGTGFAQHALGEQLALIDRQCRPGHIGILASRVRTFSRMYAGSPDFQRPGRQRRGAHGLAGGDIGGNRLRDVAPTGRLPGFKRTLRPAEAPAHGEIEVAGVVGHVLQLNRCVMENIAEDGPQELRLRMRRSTQCSKLFRRILHLQDGADFFSNLAGRDTVILRGQIEHLDFLALLAENAAAGLLTQRALRNQGLQPGRIGEIGVPRIVGQRVLHGLDDVGQRIQADDIGGAIGGALRTADLGAGQRIDLIEAETEGLGMVHDRQNGKHADAVGDEVRRIQCADDTLAEARSQPGFQRVQRAGVGTLRPDNLDQMHVARGIEEVDAAEARANACRQSLRQRVHRQAGSIGRNDGPLAKMRGNLCIEIVLPVHALGDGFDDQIALGEQRQVLVVVGGIDEFQLALAGQRGGVQFLEAVEGLLHDTVLVALLGRQVKQHDRHVGIGEVRGNLRPHHAGAENSRFFHDQLVQLHLLLSVFFRFEKLKRTFEL